MVITGGILYGMVLLVHNTLQYICTYSYIYYIPLYQMLFVIKSLL